MSDQPTVPFDLNGIALCHADLAAMRRTIAGNEAEVLRRSCRCHMYLICPAGLAATADQPSRIQQSGSTKGK